MVVGALAMRWSHIVAWHHRADLEAREAVLRILEEKRTEEHKRDVRVLVLEEPSGLPEVYEVRLWRAYLDTQLALLTFRRAGTQVSGELITKEGVFRGAVPAGELDALVRQILYLASAREEGGEDHNVALFTTHVADSTVELGGSLEDSKPLLSLGPWQATQNTIDDSGNLDRFAHTFACRELEGLAERYLRPVAPTPALVQHFLGRLAPSRSPTSDDAENREVIEAKLAAHLLVEWRVAEALPALRSLGLSVHARILEIALAPEPREVLAAAVTASEWKVGAWAFDYLGDAVSPEIRRDVLVHALRELDPVERNAAQRIEWAFEDLSELPSSAEVTSAVENLLSRREMPRETRVQAQDLLLHLTGDPRFYRELLQEMNGPAPANNAFDVRLTIAQCLVRHSAATGRDVERTGRALRDLLGSKTSESDLHELLRLFGELGRPEDAEVVGRYLLEDPLDVTVDVAIEAMAHLDPARAIEAARKRIRFCVETKERFPYRFKALEHLRLLSVLEGREAIPEVELALANLETLDRVRTQAPWIELLLRQLRAVSIDERVQGAIECLRDRWSPPGLRARLVERLVADGAARESLEALIQKKERRRPRSTWSW